MRKKKGHCQQMNLAVEMMTDIQCQMIMNMQIKETSNNWMLNLSFQFHYLNKTWIVMLMIMKMSKNVSR